MFDLNIYLDNHHNLLKINVNKRAIPDALVTGSDRNDK